jgi:hypothetical protein
MEGKIEIKDKIEIWVYNPKYGTIDKDYADSISNGNRWAYKNKMIGAFLVRNYTTIGLFRLSFEDAKLALEAHYNKEIEACERKLERLKNLKSNVENLKAPDSI